MSNARPASASVFGTERDETERDVLVERGIEVQDRELPGRTVVAEDRLRPSTAGASDPTKSSICAVVICGMPYAPNSGVDAAPEPEREAARR